MIYFCGHGETFTGNIVCGFGGILSFMDLIKELERFNPSDGHIYIMKDGCFGRIWLIHRKNNKADWTLIVGHNTVLGLQDPAMLLIATCKARFGHLFLPHPNKPGIVTNTISGIDNVHTATSLGEIYTLSKFVPITAREPIDIRNNAVYQADDALAYQLKHTEELESCYYQDGKNTRTPEQQELQETMYRDIFALGDLEEPIVVADLEN